MGEGKLISQARQMGVRQLDGYTMARQTDDGNTVTRQPSTDGLSIQSQCNKQHGSPRLMTLLCVQPHYRPRVQHNEKYSQGGHVSLHIDYQNIESMVYTSVLFSIHSGRVFATCGVQRTKPSKTLETTLRLQQQPVQQPPLVLSISSAGSDVTSLVVVGVNETVLFGPWDRNWEKILF